MIAFQTWIQKLAEGETPLTEEETYAAFQALMEEKASQAQMGAFLMGMRLRGETAPQMIGALRALREQMISVMAPPGAVDIVGTGGDRKGTYNISTCAAFVVAACGVPVAKHGNKALSSRSGAADVLLQLGVRLEQTPEGLARCLKAAGICFLFGPAHHTALRHLAGVRRELGIRTIFNLLAPLTNPARVTRQLIGVYSETWLEKIAQTLASLGSEHVWVVCGHDGLDEVTVTGPTHVVALNNGTLQRFEITPQEAGLPCSPLAALIGGTPEENAHALRCILEGSQEAALDAYRDSVLINAAATLIVAGRTPSLQEGVFLARKALETGAARACLEKLQQASHATPPPLWG